jgi:ATP phosphoribosyltransferase
VTVPLRIALPSKGRMAEPSYRLFRDAGMPFEPDGRRLRLPLPEHDLEILFARADDIPVWVEDRAVDCGIAGENQVTESGVGVDVRLALGFGGCRLVVAAPIGGVRAVGDLAGQRIATSYPRTVGRFLAGRGIPATCIPITGSVELAPGLGAAEAIADLVSSGETLRQNGLVEIDTVAQVSSRLVVNPARLKLDGDRLGALIEALEAAVH